MTSTPRHFFSVPGMVHIHGVSPDDERAFR